MSLRTALGTLVVLALSMTSTGVLGQDASKPAAAEATAEPGGIMSRTTPISVSANGGSCTFHFPYELFDNKQMFQKSWKPTDFASASSYGRCANGVLNQGAKDSLTFELPKVDSRLGWKRSPVSFVLGGAITSGRLTGKVSIWVQDWEIPFKTIIGPQFRGKQDMHIYFRDGQMFYAEADYSRPMRAAAEQRAKEQAAAAEAARIKAAEVEKAQQAAIAEATAKLDAAMQAGDCDAVKAAEAILPVKRHGDCIVAAALKSNDPRKLFLTAARLDGDRDRDRAKLLYNAIIERFPKEDLALDAAKRLAAIADVEAVERSNAAAKSAVELQGQANREAVGRAQRDQSNALERAQREAKEQQRNACLDRKRACEGRCDAQSSNLNRRFECKQGCERCIF